MEAASCGAHCCRLSTDQAMVATRFSSSPNAPADPEPIGVALHPDAAPEPVLCRHCGRTASNGISCEGACVADSGY